MTNLLVRAPTDGGADRLRRATDLRAEIDAAPLRAAVASATALARIIHERRKAAVARHG